MNGRRGPLLDDVILTTIIIVSRRVSANIISVDPFDKE